MRYINKTNQNIQGESMVQLVGTLGLPNIHGEDIYTFSSSSFLKASFCVSSQLKQQWMELVARMRMCSVISASRLSARQKISTRRAVNVAPGTLTLTGSGSPGRWSCTLTSHLFFSSQVRSTSFTCMCHRRMRDTLATVQACQQTGLSHILFIWESFNTCFSGTDQSAGNFW